MKNKKFVAKLLVAKVGMPSDDDSRNKIAKKFKTATITNTMYVKIG